MRQSTLTVKEESCKTGRRKLLEHFDGGLEIRMKIIILPKSCASLFLSQNKSTYETRKNVFYFTLKALFVLDKIKTLELQIFKFHDVIKCLIIKGNTFY